MERCEIIRDLLPVYIDGLTSEETAKVVEEHLSHCANCQALLEQMQTPVPEYDPMRNVEFRKVLKKQRDRNTKKVALFSILAVLLAAAVLTAALWVMDVFYYIGTYESPNGQVKPTVYSRDVTEFIPVKDHFTLVDEGMFQGRTILWGEFDGLWWSHDSNYQVVSLMDDGECWLTLFDFVRNTGNNLDSDLERGIYGMEEFENIAKNAEGEKLIEFRFLQWSKYDNNMLVYFSYLDTDGIDRDGYFWYNYNTGEVTGAMHMPVQAVVGEITWINNGLYSMEMTDEAGETLQFQFTISDATTLRNTEVINIGHRVQVAYRGDTEYVDRPWDLVLDWQNALNQNGPIAISVTVLE